jgi:pilus assembly protein Flp/PilA
VFNALLTRIGFALQSRLVVEERGAAAVERGLIVGLVAVVIIGVVGTLGGMLLGWADGGNGGLSAP